MKSHIIGSQHYHQRRLAAIAVNVPNVQPEIYDSLSRLCSSSLSSLAVHREYLVCSYLRSGKISNWWQLCNLRSPAGSLRRLLVCSNAAVLSAAVLRKKERKYVDYYHSKS